MLERVLVKNYPAPPVDKQEILRYAGCKGEADARTAALLEECLIEAEQVCAYRVCYRVFDVKQNGEGIEMGGLKTDSVMARRHLGTFKQAAVFAATIGLGIDRLIHKYASVMTAKALLLQAIGAERIEALCDVFCAELKEKYSEIGVRFSAGYGDFSLSAQREIFTALDCPRQIGLTLNDSLLMSPTKSVTAIVGIKA
jgi:hypothetical protein